MVEWRSRSLRSFTIWRYSIVSSDTHKDFDVTTSVTLSCVVTVAGICNSVGGSVFFDMPLRCRCRWRISVSVKARVVNWKQVDVAVWLS